MKWRQGASGSVQTADSLEQMAQQLDHSLAGRQLLMAASVRRSAASLHAFFNGVFHRVQVARVEKQLAGLTICYDRPDDLGVDRWLAMLAARRLTGAAGFALMDAGSAITLDLVDAQGLHRGGLILPGLKLQRAALENLNDRLGHHLREQPGVAAAALGLNSRDALINSGAYAAAAALELMASQAGVSPGNCFITGGDGQIFRSRFPSAVFCDDLVLDGLSVIFAQGGVCS